MATGWPDRRRSWHRSLLGAPQYHTTPGMPPPHGTHRCDIFCRKRPYRFTRFPNGSSRFIPHWRSGSRDGLAGQTRADFGACLRPEHPPRRHTTPLTVMTIPHGFLRILPLGAACDTSDNRDILVIYGHPRTYFEATGCGQATATIRGHGPACFQKDRFTMFNSTRV